MRIFWKENCKIAAASEHRPPAAWDSAPRPQLSFQFKGFQHTLFLLL